MFQILPPRQLKNLLGHLQHHCLLLQYRVSRPLKRREGKLTYVLQYSAFLLISAVILAKRALKHHHDLIHVHNMPDFLVFSAIITKLRGSRVILDLHDPMPELMRSIFGIDESSRTIRLLKKIEKISLNYADRIITVNEACRKIFAARSCPREKIEVVMNAHLPLEPGVVLDLRPD